MLVVFVLPFGCLLSARCLSRVVSNRTSTSHPALPSRFLVLAVESRASSRPSIELVSHEFVRVCSIRVHAAPPCFFFMVQSDPTFLVLSLSLCRAPYRPSRLCRMVVQIVKRSSVGPDHSNEGKIYLLCDVLFLV